MGRVGLAAPFEGRERVIGYDAFPAFRIAIRNGIPSLPVDFVAFNDDGDPARAARVAADLAADPAVLVVVGHGMVSTTLAALPVYQTAGLPLIAIGAAPEALPVAPGLFVLSPSAAALNACARASGAPCAAGPRPDPGGPLAAFAQVSGGAAATRRSSVAYDATLVALAAVRAAAARGTPTRASVAAALRDIRVEGLSGEIRFGPDGRWNDAPAFPAAP